MKCFYHKTDLDGHCSGAIVLKKFPQCQMFGVDYNDGLVVKNLTPNEEVYVVDFSFSIDEMIELNNICKLHWIDHHKSKIEDASKTGFLSTGGQLLEIGQAGCELTWKYLYPDEGVPRVVHLLGRYDVWDHNNPDVLRFQYGIRQEKNTIPQHGIWINLFKNKGVQKIIDRGEIILKYENTQNEKYAKSMSYETEFEGLRAIVMNKPFSNSKVFDFVYDPKKHDIMILFGYKSKEFKYTLFADKDNIDVSKIAKKYGGGRS
jgi:oligoribonuclease NrnB/cAMP/cGMP phosphodiesterase (DHH superfamily)